MMNLRKGELYVFCDEPAEAGPIYAVFEEYESGCLYVNFMLSSGRFETEGCLPDGYVCARPATENEKADFERTLEIYRRRLSRIERCLSERGAGDVESELRKVFGRPVRTRKAEGVPVRRPWPGKWKSER